MAAPTRTKRQREFDLYHIAEMYCKQLPQLEMVEELKKTTGSEITQAVISRDIKEIKKRWAESEISNIDERIVQELTKIDLVEREAYLAWEKSKGSKFTISEKKVIATADNKQTVVTDKGELVVEPTNETQIGLAERTTKQEETVGDPRWLDIINKCIDRRIRLLGLDAPKKIIIEDETEEQQAEIQSRKAQILFGLLQPPDTSTAGSTN